MVLLLAAASALAAAPNPDRPYVTRTAFLIEERTLEAEIGLELAQALAVPVTLKYALGNVAEVRLWGRSRRGARRRAQPRRGPEGGVLRLWRAGLCALGGVPGFPTCNLAPGEPSSTCSTQACSAERGSPWRIRVNGGLDLLTQEATPADPRLAMGLALTYKPDKRLRFFGEVNGSLALLTCSAEDRCGVDSVSGGTLVHLTQHLALDAGVGYRIPDSDGYVTIGMVANFGSFK